MHFALQKLHIMPREWLNMSKSEKAFCIASIQIRVDAEEKASKEAQRH